MLHRLFLTFPLLSLALIAFASPAPLEARAPGLIDDLLKGVLSGVTKLIKDILDGTVSGLDNVVASKPLLCLDSCCKCNTLTISYSKSTTHFHFTNRRPGYDVSAELTKLFKDSNGQCNDNARGAVRLGFHDAGAWDKNSPNGGADGSFLMNFGEDARPENNGLQNIRTVLRGVQSKFKVGYADLAQYAHNHATVTCPRGPRIKTFVGRKDATQAAPMGLLPDANDSVETLIALFANKGLDADDLVALVGAHTTSKQRNFDTTPSNVGKPLDTTPGVWDVNFYNDTLNNPHGSDKIFVLPSDQKLSVHAQTKDEFHSYVGNQKDWNEDYAKAWIKMSLNGVVNLKSLSDCTKTLPVARPNGR
jgi:catalase (peroxidase I)